MAVPTSVTTTFPATISTSGEGNGVLIGLQRPSALTNTNIGISGTYGTAVLVIEGRLGGGSRFTPIGSFNTKTLAAVGTGGTITLADDTSYVFSFESAAYDQINVYASTLTTGSISVEFSQSATPATPSVVNATTSNVQSTGAITSASPTAGVGYATGAGGAVTQATDKSTTVVSNTITTAITLNNAQLNAATIVGFTFTNSAIAATDTVLVTHQSAGTSGAYTLNAFPGSGSAVISVRNNTAGNLSEAIVLRVTVIKSVSA